MPFAPLHGLDPLFWHSFWSLQYLSPFRSVCSVTVPRISWPTCSQSSCTRVRGQGPKNLCVVGEPGAITKGLAPGQLQIPPFSSPIGAATAQVSSFSSSHSAESGFQPPASASPAALATAAAKTQPDSRHTQQSFLPAPCSASAAKEPKCPPC